MSTIINDIKVMTLKGNRIIQQVKTQLIPVFLIVDMGSISFYLGLKIKQNWENRTIKLSQFVNLYWQNPQQILSQ